MDGLFIKHIMCVLFCILVFILLLFLLFLLLLLLVVLVFVLLSLSIHLIQAVVGAIILVLLILLLLFKMFKCLNLGHRNRTGYEYYGERVSSTPSLHHSKSPYHVSRLPSADRHLWPQARWNRTQSHSGVIDERSVV